MPTPKPNENEDDFVERCIPIVIEEGTADDGEQAAAICHSMWRTHEKEKNDSEGQKMGKMSWFDIKSEAEADEIWIYGEIGAWGISAKDFIKELKALKKKRVDMHINSPGGDVFDGAAVYNAIKRHSSSITTYIDGLAASIASVIALAGDKVVMAENGIYMMHNPWGMVLGNANDMRKQADVLDKVRDTMTGAYMEKSGKTHDEIVEILDSETWMNADEAMEAGFIDEISGKMDLAACAQFAPIMAKLGYKKIPEIFGKKPQPTTRDLERALRDAGCTLKQAKAILSEGLKDGLRDEVVVDAQPPDGQAPRDVEPAAHRDVGQPKPKKDRTADLLTRAEMIAPTNK